MNAPPVLVFDTSIGSLNIGDQIIMDSVYRAVNSLFSNSQILNAPTHDVINKQTYKLNRLSLASFVGGSNLLSSDHRFLFKKNRNQWAVDIRDAKKLNNVILLGAGWINYQKKPSLLTGSLYRTLLTNQFKHAVRDGYTLHMLKRIGVDNVLNTGCPTMWELSKDHCRQVETKKSKNVVFTLTDYSKDIKSDGQLINFLGENYEKIYFWPQGSGDIAYLSSLMTSGIEILHPSLKAYDDILSTDVEFIGTRLHAGIRALQKKKRTIILAIDNRAKEISRDTNLFTLERESIAELKSIVSSSFITNISINEDEIAQWKSQFQML